MKEEIRDDIIEQVWQAKDEIARECGYDLHKLAELLREKQAEGEHKVVDYTDQRSGPAPAST